MTIRCYACHGRKEIAPLGGILKKCGACGGVGYSIPSRTHDDDMPAPVIESVKVEQKKRGRPKANSV